MLLERGADPNVVDSDECTPLHIACGTGGHRCISILIKYGGNVNVKSKTGSTPLH
jgi:ankyrin repeat protein